MIQTREALIANGIGLAQLRVEIGLISEIIFKYSNKGSERKKRLTLPRLDVVSAVEIDSFLKMKSNCDNFENVLAQLVSNCPDQN